MEQLQDALDFYKDITKGGYCDANIDILTLPRCTLFLLDVVEVAHTFLRYLSQKNHTLIKKYLNPQTNLD